MVSVKRLPILVSIVLLVVGLSACSPVQKPDPEPKVDPDIARAEQLFQQQDFLGAAALYEQLANRQPTQRENFALAAADAALKGGDADSTRRLLDSLANSPLAEAKQFKRQLLLAELALLEKQAAQALQHLLAVTPNAQTAPDLVRRYYQDLADAYRGQGNLFESANALQALDRLLHDPEQRLQNQAAILRSLSVLNELVLNNLQPSPPGVRGGWMQLALLVKQHGHNEEALHPAINAWRAQFPDHPALPELLSRYQEQLAEQIQQAARIAVMLPVSGPYAKAAQAIYDGIMLSHYALPEGQRPTLRFYDSSDTEQTWPIYSRAVAEGAELVIGPLHKEAVTQLIRAGELPVPVLALNVVSTDTAPPLNLYMFSLSPEDEARQAAEKIWTDGHRNPLVLTPNGSWGERLRNAFVARWEELSGESADFRDYDAKARDYSPSITSLLHIDQSKARHKQVQRWLGQKLEFEPRRRQDADAVFIAAHPRQAQSFPPLMQFHHAAELPLYATSHAWSGKLSAQQLADMRNLQLPDIPLIVDTHERQRLTEALPGINNGLARLYALGMDALQLVPHLRRLQSSPYESMDGQTGNLYMDAENKVHRQLVWLRLDEPPQIMGYAARLDLQQQDQLQPVPDAPDNGTEKPIPTS